MYLKRMSKKIFTMILFISAVFMSNAILAETQSVTERTTIKLTEFVGENNIDRVLALIKNSRSDLELSFRKNPKREEAFASLIGNCIRLLEGLDFVPPACKVLFGAFPEVDRVLNNIVQVKLGNQISSAVFPREFNNILNGVICELCPTSTCEAQYPDACESIY